MKWKSPVDMWIYGWRIKVNWIYYNINGAYVDGIFNPSLAYSLLAESFLA